MSQQLTPRSKTDSKRNYKDETTAMTLINSASTSPSKKKMVALEMELEPTGPSKEQHDHHDISSKGDLTSSVLGIIKGMVGPAILYLPHGFAGAGYVMALSIMVSSTYLFLHSSRCLMEAYQYESEKQQKDPDDEDGDQDLQALLESNDNDKDDESLYKKPETPKRLLSYPELALRVSLSMSKILCSCCNSHGWMVIGLRLLYSFPLIQN